MIVNQIFSFKPSVNDSVKISNEGKNIDIEISYHGISSIVHQLDFVGKASLISELTGNVPDNRCDRLTEQNKMLREALTHQYIHNILDWAICGISTNSSSRTSGRSERMQKFYEFKAALDKALEVCND